MRELTETELDVIEAAMELDTWQRAYDAGIPAQAYIKHSLKALRKACSDLAADGEGEWRRPE